MKLRFLPRHPLTTVLGILTLLYFGVSAHAQSGGPLVIQPKHLVFSTVAGVPSTTVQCLRIVAADSGTSWSASADQPWLTLSAASGATQGTNNISINALQSASLLPGVYQATISITGGGSPGAQAAQVTLIVNPSEGPRLSPWKDGRRGACSVSVDDSLPSGYEFLQQAGLRATYFLNGTAAPAYFSGFYQSGMEIGSHLVNHFCKEMDETTLRANIEPSISGLSYSTLTPVNEFVGLAWPCGVYTLSEQVLSSEYFLSARGYGINRLEDTTPADFMNLKSFNAHEHNGPGDDRNLKDVVDAAEAGG